MATIRKVHDPAPSMTETQQHAKMATQQRNGSTDNVMTANDFSGAG